MDRQGAASGRGSGVTTEPTIRKTGYVYRNMIDQLTKECAL